VKAPAPQNAAKPGRNERRFVERSDTSSFEVRVITYAPPDPPHRLRKAA